MIAHFCIRRQPLIVEGHRRLFNLTRRGANNTCRAERPGRLMVNGMMLVVSIHYSGTEGGGESVRGTPVVCDPY